MDREDGPRAVQAVGERMKVGRRLPSGPGGPRHLRAARAAQVADTRAAIATAIEALAGRPGRAGYPSAERLVEVGGGAFSRSRVFEHRDLVEAAVGAWRETEVAAGRPVGKPRGKAVATDHTDVVATLDAAVPDPVTEPITGDDRLRRALDALDGQKRRSARLSRENVDLQRKVDRLAKGVHDEIWPEREVEVATFAGDPLDE